MPIPEFVARAVAHYPRRFFLAALAIAAASLAAIIVGVGFDSQVVNLLPGKFDSVKALKLYDEKFEQARELTYAVQDKTGEVDLEGFIDHLVGRLQEQPWVVRVMDRSPIEMSDGLIDLQSLSVSLLLNLPPQQFDEAIRLLEPGRIEQKVGRLREDLAAGSPKAQMQLEFDPLGPVGAALAPLSGTITLENTDPMASPDGALRIVSVVTMQDSLSTPASRLLMMKVEKFNRETLATWEGSAPKLMVTGRAAYVAEMSGGMERDIGTTMLSSILLVALVFYIGFRRVLPLFGILATLLLACVAAVATGGLFLRELNLITIGFCSILVGLGVDFGMLLFGTYQSERDDGREHEAAIAAAIRRLGGAVGFGALTTAAAFLCLLWSGSAGFAQLGMLIAIGIIFAAVFMMSFFFAFSGKRYRPRSHDVVLAATHRGIDFIIARWRLLLLVSGLPLALLTFYAFSPVGVLHFEADPSLLEPENSRAGEALRAIRQEIPAAEVEPVLVLLQSQSPESAERDWKKLDAHWRKLKGEGKIAGFTSPAAFAVSPERQLRNAAKLSVPALERSKSALAAAVAAQGFSDAAFASSSLLIDRLLSVARGDHRLLDWRQALPIASPWWFLLERYFSNDPAVAAAYITPASSIADPEAKNALRELLTVPGPRLYFSGWSYTLADLIPWSKSKLIQLSVLMVAVNSILLLFHVRSARHLVILLASLLFATGALIACLKFFGLSLHLFNVLAFPLVLGVGVDYGIYVMLAARETGDLRTNLVSMLRPVLLSGLTTLAGFGSLGLAHHPALAGLGVVCGLGIAWCLVITFTFTLPACLWIRPK